MQRSGSIKNWSSPSRMQSTGHTSTHSPAFSPMHGAVITCVIFITPYLFKLPYFPLFRSQKHELVEIYLVSSPVKREEHECTITQHQTGGMVTWLTHNIRSC